MTTKEVSALLYLNVGSIPKLSDLLVQWRLKGNRLTIALSWRINDDLIDNIEVTDDKLKQEETTVEELHKFYRRYSTGASY